MSTDAHLVFSTSSYQYMQGEMCQATGWEVGAITRKCFADGESYYRFSTPVAGRDVVLVGGTVSAADTLELYDLACGLVHWGAARLDIVIPYFGHGTMERAEIAGEVVTAKNRSRLLSSIPAAAQGNRVFVVDLHVDAIAYYFEGNVRPTHVYARPLIADLVRDVGGDNFVIGCTDAGRAKWVERLAQELGVTAAFVYKNRVSDRVTEVSGVSARVSNKDVVIYDDMIRTGSSLLGAAKAYLDAGASSVSAVATHGVFPGDALDQVARAGSLRKILCTNSHPRAVAMADDRLEVTSCVPLLVSAL